MRKKQSFTMTSLHGMLAYSAIGRRSLVARIQSPQNTSSTRLSSHLIVENIYKGVETYGNSKLNEARGNLARRRVLQKAFVAINLALTN